MDGYKVTKGRVKLELQDAKEEEEGFAIKDAGNYQRWAKVVDIGPWFERVGPPEYNVGDMALVPNLKGRMFEDGDKVYMIFFQSEIELYEDSPQQGSSRF